MGEIGVSLKDIGQGIKQDATEQVAPKSDKIAVETKQQVHGASTEVIKDLGRIAKGGLQHLSPEQLAKEKEKRQMYANRKRQRILQDMQRASQATNQRNEAYNRKNQEEMQKSQQKKMEMQQQAAPASPSKRPARPGA